MPKSLPSAAPATAHPHAHATAHATAPAVPAGLDTARLSHLVGYAASRAAITLRKTFARHMAPLDIKIVEFSILMLVAQNQKVNQKQLGAELDLSAPNLAVILDRMAERGWVERVRSTVDRRAQQIHLTASGVQLVQRAEKIAATMENAALAVLSAAERALLIELLLKVSARRAGKR